MITDAKGQAIFEFIVFLPILIVLYLVMVILGSSINGSINQQKALRGYYFYLNKHNSNMPNKNDLKQLSNLNYIGMYTLGWKETFMNVTVPVATCYRSGGSILLKDEIDSCDNSSRTTRTSYVRPYTVYGICSMNYKTNGTNLYYDYLGDGNVANRCSNQ